MYGGLGIDQLILNWGGWQKRKISTVIFSVFAFVIALASGFPVFNFQEQLKTTDYPQEWYEVNNFLKKDKQDFNVLFFLGMNIWTSIGYPTVIKG